MTVSAPTYKDLRWDAATTAWTEAKRVIGDRRVTLGPQASAQYLNDPDHLSFVLARYRVAAALIGGAETVLEIGCGEGIGAGILAKGRRYAGVDMDADALAIAKELYPEATFFQRDATSIFAASMLAHAVVALDVIEHIPESSEDGFLSCLAVSLRTHGVCVIGTPSKHAEHLASPQSRAGHVNLYTPDRLRALMSRYFHVVIMAGMQDTSVHFGHPEMFHYMLVAGYGPKRD